MPKTPKRAGRDPKPGSQFLSQVLAVNIRSLRALRRLSQDELAERMRHLGHEWTRPTVSEVERAGRSVTVDEMGSLAVALDALLSELLDPERQGVHLDLGMTGPVRRTLAGQWVRGLLRVGLHRGEEGQWQYSFEPSPEMDAWERFRMMARTEGEGAP